MKRILILCALAACGDQLKVIDGAACNDDSACVLGGVTGTCQSTGFCAYPDSTCADGLRYSPGATGMEGTCVGGDVCGVDEGDACCDGDVCGANLTCSSAHTCECGAQGEACCGGATCESGLACGQGTCHAGIEHVALAWASGCALRTDGVLECWGRDVRKWGQSRPGVLVEVTPPGPIAITGVAQVERSDVHACARKTDGTVWCWGHNDVGQLGNGTTTASPVPVQVTGLTGATQLTVGRNHTCAVGVVGGVTGIYCWGRNGQGIGDSRLGNNASADSSLPVATDMSQMAASGQTVRYLAAGGYHTCAIMSDDRIWCWGIGASGQLGNNATNSSPVPVLVDLSQITIPQGVTPVELALPTRRNSFGNVMLRLSNGALYGWGNLGGGAGGTGTSVGNVVRPDSTSAVDLSALAGATVTEVVSTDRGFCALASDSTVWCWGTRTQRAIGDNDPDGATALAPVQVQGLPPSIESITGGHLAACAIDSAKHLWCWGNNRNGTLTRTPPTTLDESRLPIARDVTP